MGLKLIAASETMPVTLAEAKAHLRAVDFDDDDEVITLYCKAATDSVENFTGRALIDQTWDYYRDSFPVGEIRIPRPPLIEVLGVFYRPGNDEQEVDAAGYEVDQFSELARLVPAYAVPWPTPLTIVNAVRVRFRAGYVDEGASPVSGSVPFAIKAAILLTLGTLYENRETVVVGQTATILPWAAEQLLRPYRVHTAMA